MGETEIGITRSQNQNKNYLFFKINIISDTQQTDKRKTEHFETSFNLSIHIKHQAYLCHSWMAKIYIFFGTQGDATIIETLY